MALSEKDQHILDTLGEDEPVFIFRAKDKFATSALGQYYRVVQGHGIHEEDMKPEFADEVMARIEEFETWQLANQDKVKVPD